MNALPKPSYLSLDPDAYAWKAAIDCRRQPERYRVGKGEQGVLICEPYRSEIMPYWRSGTPSIARRIAAAIVKLVKAYLANNEFVGADMARKFLQMGYTRARRYANCEGGKYDKADDYAPQPRGTGDLEKAESAAIFHRAWKRMEAEPRYAVQKTAWKAKYG